MHVTPAGLWKQFYKLNTSLKYDAYQIIVVLNLKSNYSYFELKMRSKNGYGSIL